MTDKENIAELEERMEQFMEVVRTATDMSGLPPEMLVDFLGDEILRILDESGASKRERDQHIRELTSKMRGNRGPNVRMNRPRPDNTKRFQTRNHQVHRSYVQCVCQRSTSHHVKPFHHFLLQM